VYNPFSVVNCLYNKKFDHYWYNSGTSLVAYNYRYNPECFINIISNRLVTSNFEPIDDLKTLESESFLFQTGYVTIDKIIKKLRFTNYIMKCPNNEISFAIAKDFGNMNLPFPGNEESINKKFSSFVNAFETSDETECSRIFSSLLSKAALPMHAPVEYLYQFLLFVLLNTRGFRARLEEHAGDGRADIIYTSPSDFQVVIEIKRSRPDSIETVPALPEAPPSGAALPGFQELPDHVKSCMEKDISEAVSQILTRNYLRPFYMEGETRVCAVAVYGWTHCMFRFYGVDWNARTIRDPAAEKQADGSAAGPNLTDRDEPTDQELLCRPCFASAIGKGAPSG
ncbi:MAG: hypothetical protein LBQ12_15230, partial [Deltaproteobacteria bacterium]|nr:hypothetical protein [Deltaproteobacteria bacterium]